jgi:RNA polymerase sigma factor (sigma-70 family)
MLSGEPSNHSGQDCEAGEEAVSADREHPVDVPAWFERDILPHRAGLERYLARNFPHEADLDDIVQESLERILTRLGDEPIDNPKFYLRRTAWSLLQTRIRRRGIVTIEHYADMSMFDFQCDAPLPDEICVAREELALLAAAYSELSPRAQDAVRLVRLEGRPYVDVARTLDISVSGVEKQLRRAVRHLRAGVEAGSLSSNSGSRIADSF